MLTEKFIKNGIHYIRETWNSGVINIYPDPKFLDPPTNPPLPPLPDLTTVNQKLDFIIDQLNLKKRFHQ